MIEQSDSIGTLAARKSRVMAQLARVAKRGRNDFHRYDYALEADLVDAVRPLLASEGISISTDVEILDTRDVGKDLMVTVRLTVQEQDADGAWIRSSCIGQGSDRGDKAAYKAITGALKYWLAKTYLVATGDDPEQDETPQQPAPPKAKPRRQSGNIGKDIEDTAAIAMRAQAHQLAAKLAQAYAQPEDAMLERLRAITGEIAKEDGQKPTPNTLSRAFDRLAQKMHTEDDE